MTDSVVARTNAARRLPTGSRPSRAIVEPVKPIVDAGRFAAKATIDEPVEVVADVFTDGHDQVGAALRFRQSGKQWREVPMLALGNDRFSASFVPELLGRWEYEVVGWVDHLSSWRHGVELKLAAGVDMAVDLQIGVVLIDAAIDRASEADAAELSALAAQWEAGDTASIGHRHEADPMLPGLPELPDALDQLFWRSAPRDPAASSGPYPVDVDPVRGRFSAWYEFFPRSSASGEPGPRRILDAIERLDYVAFMGFDTVYLPPVHPIGSTFRKGRNNSTTALDTDVGSPWAIGSGEGGHEAVDPDLGTIDDIDCLAQECSTRGLALALDIAFQCTPDHPWVHEHPQWFAHRPDGTIQYAENPPKKYQDIYPIDFESADWMNLWAALADVVRFWIRRGVTIFRVDNPHTKAFAFWEWAIGTIRAEHPDVIFLAEAFTRPRVMERLAKLGFNQSYTYFTWRQSSWELREYFEDLAERTVDYFRPNAWPNTPDILTEQLQTGGRAMFAVRAVLAATLSPSWGVYGPAFELLEHRALRPGSEEYLDSEKYQLRHWNLDDPHSLAPLLSRLNGLRQQFPALGHLRTLRFHETGNPALLCYSKSDPSGSSPPVLVVVNLDAAVPQEATVDVDLAALGLPYGSDYSVVDHLTTARANWHGAYNWVRLDPAVTPAHVFTVES